MKNIRKLLRRPLYGLSALTLLVGLTAPVFVNQLAAAAGQVQARSIKMSTAVPGATGVTYTVSFNTATAFASGADVVVEFCSDTPLIGANCAFSTTANSNTVPIVTGAAASAGTFTSLGSGNVARVDGLSTSGISAGGTVTFDLTGVTNPVPPTGADGDTGYSFYARIYVYTAGTANSNYTAPASTGTPPATKAAGTDKVDYGGIALATVSTINITARVMETLSLCTSSTDISGGNFGGAPADIKCTNSKAPSIVIGHGSPTAVIDANNVDTAPAFFQMSTNATNGADVRMKATNTCTNGGLSTTGGADCTFIPGITTTTAPVKMNSGTPGFGLFVSPSQTTATVATSTGTVTPSAIYYDSTAGHNNPSTDYYFGMETGATGVTSTYGSVIASCTAPVSQVNTMLTFGATAGLTTPAGIYTGGESLIATGKF